MRFSIALCLLSASSFAQPLPSFVAGAGEVWARGTSSKFVTDISVAQQISGSSFYVWSDLATPDSRGGQSSPVPSTLTAGGAYVAAQSGRLSLLLILQGGFSIASSPTSVAPAFSGSVGFPIQVGRSWGLMPYMKGLATSNTQVSTATSAVVPGSVSTVIQFGLQVQYDFFAKPLAPVVPTVKMMRKILKRVGIRCSSL